MAGKRIYTLRRSSEDVKKCWFTSIRSIHQMVVNLICRLHLALYRRKYPLQASKQPNTHVRDVLTTTEHSQRGTYQKYTSERQGQNCRTLHTHGTSSAVRHFSLVSAQQSRAKYSQPWPHMDRACFPSPRVQSSSPPTNGVQNRAINRSISLHKPCKWRKIIEMMKKKTKLNVSCRDWKTMKFLDDKNLELHVYGNRTFPYIHVLYIYFLVMCTKVTQD